MCQNVNFGINSAKLIHDLPARNYRRQMKPILPRKATASARINLNKFWNDLEEFYSRYDDRRSSNNNNPLIEVFVAPLPNYTTDTYDHEREAAENDLNEKMEAEKFEGSTYISYSSNLDFRSGSTSSFDDDLDSGSEDSDFYQISHLSSTSLASRSFDLRPPRTLIDLIQRFSSKHSN